MSDTANVSEFDKKWEAFEKDCMDCNACGLCDGITHKVIYRGSRKAPLMVVGEAPGANEDEKGLPFVGRSGQLLQHLLMSLGFEEEDYHICNICKCRPPENRRPLPEEIAACKKLLAKQFALVNPKVILLCGSTAYEGFFNVKPVMKNVRGQFIEKNGYLIMTTYHPAFALRDPKNKIPMYEDISLVRSKLAEMGLMEPLENS